MAIRAANVWGVLGVVVGVLGVAGPILWDYYKTRDELQLLVADQSVIFDKSKKIPGLEISYAGQPVDELFRITFSVYNSGRTPILEKDVVEPVYIDIPKTAKTIEAKVVSTNPKDLRATATFDKDTSRVAIAFPLLNPGDSINVGVLTQSSRIDFDAGARIAGIKNLVIVPLAAMTPSKQAPITLYIVGIFSIFAIIVGISAIKDVKSEYRVKGLIRSGTFSLPSLKTRGELISHINTNFTFTTPKERRPTIEFIGNLADTENFVEDHHQEILKEISRLVESATTNLVVVAMMFGVATAGIIYIIYQTEF